VDALEWLFSVWMRISDSQSVSCLLAGMWSKKALSVHAGTSSSCRSEGQIDTRAPCDPVLHIQDLLIQDPGSLYR